MSIIIPSAATALAAGSPSAIPSTTAALPVETVDIETLQPDPAHPRQIDPAELDALERSLRTWGVVQPILARRADRIVIGGHQRLLAARRLGQRTIPVIWLDLSADQAHLLGLALNRISGAWDEALLARLLAELQTAPDVDLSLSGFGEDEVTDLLRSLATRAKQDQIETFDLDAALEAARSCGRAKPGDVWGLGEHRLSCGDATVAADVERLLDGRRPAMAFQDPPYNAKIGKHGGQQPGARSRPIANDDLDPVAWGLFVQGWAANLLRVVDGALYICMSSKEWPTMGRVLAEAGGHWSDTLIWTKDRFTLGRSSYQRAYEPIWFGWREGARAHWCGDRDQSDVWAIERPSASPLHMTMKPLALMERAIHNSSVSGDLVLDLFGGSGSTLIACERTGRRCAMLELDPTYVDVIIARWESFSGGTAVRLDG